MEQTSLPFIEIIARQKMMEHGLTDWNFKLDKAKRRLGSCQYHSKTISLSIHLFKLPEEEIMQTLLHEIAHALVGPRAGHGPRWKQKAIAIGCNAQRTSKLSMVEAPTRVIRCDQCDYTLSLKRFRLPRWITRKRYCPKCRMGKTSEQI